jgi:hypothetical protein
MLRYRFAGHDGEEVTAASTVGEDVLAMGGVACAAWAGVNVAPFEDVSSSLRVGKTAG